MSELTPIEFYFDVASPYSYLAAMQIEDFAAEVGRPTRWVPFLLGGVFRATGNEMPARIKEKAAWMFRDLRMSTQMLGIPFRFPSAFPINTVAHQRALIAAEAEGGQEALRALAKAFFEAYFGAGQDITQGEWFRTAAAKAGLAVEPLLAANDDPAIKAKLVENTEQAVARGAFGAPTFFIGDSLFWGHDRFETIRWYLEHVRTED